MKCLNVQDITQGDITRWGNRIQSVQDQGSILNYDGGGNDIMMDESTIQAVPAILLAQLVSVPGSIGIHFDMVRYPTFYATVWHTVITSDM